MVKKCLCTFICSQDDRSFLEGQVMMFLWTLINMQAVLLGGVTDKVGAAVTSLCFNQQGDLLLVGYANGVLCLWDVSRQSVTKVAEHTLAIVHTLFLGQDAPAARYFRAISGDCKGKVALHTFSQQMLPLLRRFSVTTQVYKISFKSIFILTSGF